ncbi:hypothetical protein OHC33_000107 [Knufia fluminis]|uniref:Uncharacterized protein n=1 Tax=Knufia fluminis TaxID=191047 RepID=A0AAN8IC92_9EURO|nr:hypothetical protein OHC33_000107 [Knufia fluminis]
MDNKTSSAKQQEKWIITHTEPAPTEKDFDEIIWRLLPNPDPDARSEIAQQMAVPLDPHKRCPTSIIFVQHRNLDLSRSSFIYVHSDNVFAKSFEMDDDGHLMHTTRSCEGNRNKTSIEDPIQLTYEWGADDSAELHLILDDRLREHNCFQLTARPPLNSKRAYGKPVKQPKPRPCSFTFLVAVDFTHPDFLRSFNHRRQTFTEVAATAFYCFLKALEFTSERKHLAQITAQQDSYAEFLRITHPVSDDMPAIRREEKNATQAQRQQDKKTKKELKKSSIRSLIASNKISLPCGEPQDYARMSEESSGSGPQSASIEPARRLVEWRAGPSANSSADTFTTTIEEASTEGSDASTLIEDPEVVANDLYDDIAHTQEVELRPQAASSCERPRRHLSRSSSQSQSASQSNDIVSVSSSPISPKIPELSRASTPSRVSCKSLAPSDLIDEEAQGAKLAARHPLEHDTLLMTMDSCGDEKTSPTISAADLDKEATAHQADVHNGVNGTNILSPIHEERLASGAVTSPSETLVDDASLEQLNTPLSKLSLSSDASTVVPEEQPIALLIRNGNKKRPQKPTQRLSSRVSSARTSPVKTRKPPACLLRRGSSSVLPIQTGEFMHVVGPSAAYTRFTDYAQRGLLKSNLLDGDVCFSYARPNVMTNCWLPDCQRPTNSCDSRTALCPRCGPYSYVRYCSVRHLHIDARRHYTEDCGRRPNHLPYIDEATIHPVNNPPRPFIGCMSSMNDSFERHRQALYHSYPPDVQVDYYIFSDADNLVAREGPDAAVTSAMLAKYRGTGSVIATVQISPKDVQKAQFASLLENLLSLGCAAGTLDQISCGIFFLLIKSDLQDQDLWDESMIDRVCLAMQLEFGWRVPPRYY